MKKTSDGPDLQELAEAWLRTARSEVGAMPTEVLQNFVYDLQVYQVELAMQNEELRRVERELERSKDRYQALYELAPVAYLTLDEAALIKELNQQASTLLGIERSKLCGSCFADRILPAERAGFYTQHRRSLELGDRRSYELTLATPIQQRAVRCEAQQGQTADGKPHVLLVLCDITEQRVADAALRTEMTQRALTEKTLRRERDFAQGLLATTPGIFLELNRQGRILRCNRNFEQFLGYRIDEILGADAFALMLAKPAHEAIRARFANALNNPQGPFTSSDIVPVRTRAGEERAVAWSSSRVTDDQGHPVGMLLTGVDMTERQRLEADLRQSQKMEAVGQLASGIAHDFNNLLMGQAGLTEIAASKLSADSPAQPYLTQIRQALSLGTGLTRQLLDFARKRPVERVSIDLSRLVERSGALLRCLLSQNIELQFQLGEAVWVLGDPGQLEQVLLNLFINARDALPNGGTLRVTTDAGCMHGTSPHEAPDPRPGQYAMLTVTDSGVGMDEITQRRAFEPFFTTKKMGAGTGLGLATVYGIVNQGGGHIHLRSAPGQGTMFCICLPKAAPPGPSPEPPRLPTPFLGRGETLVVIEDEATVRSVIHHRLQRQGYRVLPAENGDQALQLCRSEPDIALVITDIILPGVPGDEVARQILKLRPGLPILYMSALPPDRLVREGRLDPGAVSLQKPFSEHDLLTKVQELLAKAGFTTDPGLGTGAQRSGHIVLVVEDDATNRMVLAELLELSDYTVLAAAGAEAALALLAQEPRVGIVIADYGLPGKNGLVLLKELLACWRTLRAILITGRGLDDPLLAGVEAQSRLRLLRKPFDFNSLLATIAALLTELP